MITVTYISGRSGNELSKRFYNSASDHGLTEVGGKENQSFEITDSESFGRFKELFSDTVNNTCFTRSERTVCARADQRC